jgi:hypothetical protein
MEVVHILLVLQLLLPLWLAQCMLVLGPLDGDVEKATEPWYRK